MGSAGGESDRLEGEANQPCAREFPLPFPPFPPPCVCLRAVAAAVLRSALVETAAGREKEGEGKGKGRQWAKKEHT
jgi:hypothetical protein